MYFSAENSVVFEELVLLNVEAAVEGSGCHYPCKESQDFAPKFWYILTKVFKTKADPNLAGSFSSLNLSVISL